MTESASYLVVLLERQYLANLLNGLSQQEQICKQMLNKNKYDVMASGQMPKLKADIKHIKQILLAENNIINCHLENTYKFKFESVKVDPMPEEKELEVVK